MVSGGHGITTAYRTSILHLELSSYSFVKATRVIAALGYEGAASVGANSRFRNNAQLLEHFSKGDPKADCLVLECVGFDPFLYNGLLERNNFKRKHDSNTEPGPRKRLRVNQNRYS